MEVGAKNFFFLKSLAFEWAFEIKLSSKKLKLAIEIIIYEYF